MALPEIPKMFSIPLTQSQYEDALQKGLGRALLHADQCGIDDVLDLVVEACRDSKVYDSQVDGDRVPWLMEMLRVTDKMDEVAQELVRLLREGVGGSEQLCRLAGEMHKYGCVHAKDIVYLSAFETDEYPYLIGAEEIIQIEGEQGLLHYVESLMHDGQAFTAREDCRFDHDLPIQFYDECFGEGKGIRILERLRMEHSCVERYLVYHEECAAESEQVVVHSNRANEKEKDLFGLRRSMGTIPAEDILGSISSLEHRQNFLFYSIWAGKVTPRVRQLVVDGLGSCDNDAELMCFLAVLGRHSYVPSEEQLEWIFDFPSENRVFRKRRNRVLGSVEHPAVRERALRHLAAGDWQEDELQLFQENLCVRDSEILRDHLTIPRDQYDLHSMLFDLCAVMEHDETGELVDIAQIVYEHTPCGMCRFRAMEYLQKLDAAPDWMREEYQFDAETLADVKTDDS